MSTVESRTVAEPLEERSLENWKCVQNYPDMGNCVSTVESRNVTSSRCVVVRRSQNCRFFWLHKSVCLQFRPKRDSRASVAFEQSVLLGCLVAFLLVASVVATRTFWKFGTSIGLVVVQEGLISLISWWLSFRSCNRDCCIFSFLNHI